MSKDAQADPGRSTVRRLTYSEARALLDAALAEAERLNVRVSIAVLDAGRELLAFAREDYAPVITGELAIAKAYTAGSFRRESAEMAKTTAPDGPFFGIQHGSSRGLVTFGGGIPLFSGRDVIGAVGASGGSADEDVAVASAAVAAYEGL